ncbi:preprotein translocase subunit YajC [Candidatus Poriferisodalis sp.]|uniref:preprotein translocase subunit YajC n=1 Tax=Candidatus Poriferisodalis sp. TaxID=3101277 RepID=UPI003D0F88AD
MNAGLLLPILLIVVLYFIMIRPQQRKMKAREAMIRSADVGDVIATAGGVIGKIVAIEEPGDVVYLEVDSDVELRVQRRAIGEILAPAPGVADADSQDIADADDAD